MSALLAVLTVTCRDCGATHRGWWHRGWRLDPDDARGDVCPPCDVARRRAWLWFVGSYGRLSGRVWARTADEASAVADAATEVAENRQTGPEVWAYASGVADGLAWAMGGVSGHVFRGFYGRRDSAGRECLAELTEVALVLDSELERRLMRDAGGSS